MTSQVLIEYNNLKKTLTNRSHFGLNELQLHVHGYLYRLNKIAVSSRRCVSKE